VLFLRREIFLTGFFLSEFHCTLKVVYFPSMAVRFQNQKFLLEQVFYYFVKHMFGNTFLCFCHNGCTVF
jgi:hypothetical protein